jgi:hypothetical protein
MTSDLQEQVSISMSKGTFLVLFEYLAHSYESWCKAAESSDASSFTVQKPDHGERIALWQLEGAIERTFPEIFSSEYPQLLANWKQHLVSGGR